MDKIDNEEDVLSDKQILRLLGSFRSFNKTRLEYILTYVGKAPRRILFSIGMPGNVMIGIGKVDLFGHLKYIQDFFPDAVSVLDGDVTDLTPSLFRLRGNPIVIRGQPPRTKMDIDDRMFKLVDQVTIWDLAQTNHGLFGQFVTQMKIGKGDIYESFQKALCMAVEFF